jgi:hypothetical protein
MRFTNTSDIRPTFYIRNTSKRPQNERHKAKTSPFNVAYYCVINPILLSRVKFWEFSRVEFVPMSLFRRVVVVRISRVIRHAFLPDKAK